MPSGRAGRIFTSPLDYIESLRYLYGLADFERSGRFADRADVEPVKQLLHELGDPHLGRATVHIAGSKGKGSVAAMVESMVRAAGYSTGLFTSPHLHRFPERIQTSRQADEQTSKEPELRPVSTAEFAEGISEIAPAVERVRERMPDRALVTFDVLTALGFLLFRKHEVQVQVIEVGLGGLLDSTNVFGATPPPNPLPPSTGLRTGAGGEGEEMTATSTNTASLVPLVTVITNIGLEHREILGDTVAEIARQKAGIIVGGSPVIMAPQRESAADVIREVAATQGAPLTEVALACNMRRDQAGMDNQQFRLRTKTQGYNIKLPLLGKHQLDNAATAVLAVEALNGLLAGEPSREAQRGSGGSQSTGVASPLPAVDGSQRGGEPARYLARRYRCGGGAEGAGERALAGSHRGLATAALADRGRGAHGGLGPAVAGHAERIPAHRPGNAGGGRDGRQGPRRAGDGDGAGGATRDRDAGGPPAGAGGGAGGAGFP